MTKNNTKTANAASDSPSSRLDVQRESGESEAVARARTSLRPTVQAGITATQLLDPYFAEPDLNELVNALSGHVAAAGKGDLSRAEAMLVSQAQTLDLLFNKLTRQAVHNIGHYPETVALYMKLALRAQSQCRAVAESLHEMKHPRPVAFFQQANIANGPQQVNNGAAVPSQASRAGENQKPPNELLEHEGDHGNLLDGKATQSATAGNTHLEAVVPVNGDRVLIR
jgi:hypothetical protein